MAQFSKNDLTKTLAFFYKTRGKLCNKEFFKDRLILQKIAFLISSNKPQHAKTFSWYIRGPYSPKFTDEFYEEAEQINDNEIVNCSFSEDEKDLILKLKNIFDTKDYLEWELHISILFLSRQNKMSDKDELVGMVHSLKPWFSEEKIEKAYDKLKQAEIIQ